MVERAGQIGAGRAGMTVRTGHAERWDGGTRNPRGPATLSTSLVKDQRGRAVGQGNSSRVSRVLGRGRRCRGVSQWPHPEGEVGEREQAPGCNIDASRRLGAVRVHENVREEPRVGEAGGRVGGGRREGKRGKGDGGFVGEGEEGEEAGDAGKGLGRGAQNQGKWKRGTGRRWKTRGKDARRERGIGKGLKNLNGII
jgi:hypothetical protein